MNLHELYPFPQERKKRKRVGRGPASGQGKTAGKGHKGQNARSGGGVPAWFEGGQMPLARRLPKRGFKNKFRVVYAPVNLERLLAVFADKTEILLEDIYASGMVKRGLPVKILGQGELSAAITVEAHRFSKTAKDKISAAGGTVKALEGE